MRSIKELLEVMLEHQDKFRDGLCMWGLKLLTSNIVTQNEYRVILNYIKGNKPKWYSSTSTFYEVFSQSAYYWECNNIEPRIEWIKKHIKLNQ
jgi:hypothetical protein